MKDEGITLTVLVVTIVVLLILVGVSITELNDNGGIVNQTKGVVNGTLKEEEQQNQELQTLEDEQYSILQNETTAQTAPKIESITIIKHTNPIKVGDTITLKANILPENAVKKVLIWSSSNTAIATVNEITGEVTCKTAGNVIIRAKATDGSNVEGTCNITISK